MQLKLITILILKIINNYYECGIFTSLLIVNINENNKQIVIEP